MDIARMDLVRPLKAIRQLANTTSNNSEKLIAMGDVGMRRNGSRVLPGVTREPLIVVALTMNGYADVPFTVTGEVTGAQVDCAGAPVHAMLTAPVKPPVGFACRLYTAVFRRTVATMSPRLPLKRKIWGCCANFCHKCVAQSTWSGLKNSRRGKTSRQRCACQVNVIRGSTAIPVPMSALFPPR